MVLTDPTMMTSPTVYSSIPTQLRSSEVTFFMEAHNALSARIARDAGFTALWASGLTISASQGVRDANELSWSQIVDILELMADAVDVPILVDGDTGHGNFNNARRFSRKLEDRQLGGICIEDKLFPKTNSFIGERQPLARVDEFVGKIRALLDARRSASYGVIARTEALVSGAPISEAIDRASAYADAGVDAVLVHSKQASVAEVQAFCDKWDGRCPIIVVPTTYPNTTHEDFRRMGVAGVIFANHLLRTSIHAMQRAAIEIRRNQTVVGISDMVSVGEVFDLSDDAGLRADERLYLPVTEPKSDVLGAPS